MFKLNSTQGFGRMEFIKFMEKKKNLIHSMNEDKNNLIFKSNNSNIVL
jgi:hypothetical protein